MTRTWLSVIGGSAVAALLFAQSGAAREQQPPAPAPVTAEPEVPQTETVATETTDTSGQSAQEAPVGEPEGEETAAPCASLESTQLAGVLSAVPRYGSTYVLVVPERLAATVPTASAPGIANLHVGVSAGTAAGEVARSLGITRIEEYPFSADARSQLLQDVRDEKLDAAVLWAPLAGLNILDLELDGLVSVFTVDKPRSAPASLHAASTEHPCAIAIAEELDVSGVLPAELLVSVEIRDLLHRKPPAFDLAQAREGATLFNGTCARCHGADAVADPHGLAPVDLRLSIRRFSFPGFNYIVLNGRPSKSMPAFRGTVTDEQIALIYQYLKARSNEVLPATTPAAEAPAD